MPVRGFGDQAVLRRHAQDDQVPDRISGRTRPGHNALTIPNPDHPPNPNRPPEHEGRAIEASSKGESPFIIAGVVIGALARLIKPGKQNLGLVATLLLGLAGSVIGGVIASLLGTGDIFELNVLGFIVAVIAAVLLIGVAEGLAGRRRIRR